MTASTQCLIVVLIIAILFVTEIIPLAMTAVCGALACGMLGFIPTKAVFSGMADNTVILVCAMFVVGDAMFRTGLAQKIGITVVKATGTGENKLMAGVMFISAALSSVLSNTGTVACLMPVVVGICKAAKIPVARQLMPLAFAASAGGMISMVGTPPNVIVTSALANAGFQPFGFFEFSKIGIPLTLGAIIYMILIGKYLLPNRVDEEDDETEGGSNNQASEDAENETGPLTKKQVISGVILLFVVAVMAIGFKRISLSMAATIGAALCVLTGCVTEKEAYRSIDFVTAFVLAFMMPVSQAMSSTGAGKVIAGWAVQLMGGSPTPMVVTIVLFVIACLMTQFMSNTAATAFLAPIGLAIAEKLGASPHAVLMAIAAAAAAAFATPVGTPPNTIILGVGRYRFMDYVKAGTGLILVFFVISIILLPMIWPFFPGK